MTDSFPILEFDPDRSASTEPVSRKLSEPAPERAVVCFFRGVDLVQYLYAGDDVSGQTWDHRHWTTSSARHDLFWLAVETALRL